MTDVRPTPQDPDEIEGLEALDLPDLHDDDHALGIVDMADDIVFTPDGSADDEEAFDLPIGDIEVEEEEAAGASDAQLTNDFGEADGLISDERPSTHDAKAHGSEAHSDQVAIETDDADGLETSDDHEDDDGGIEGTTEDISEGVDEAGLPAVDADEGGAFELHDFMKELADDGLGREGEGPPWVLRDDWVSGEAFADVAATGGRVVAIGAELVVLETGERAARRSRLVRHGSRVALSEGAVVVGSGSTVSLISLPLGPAPHAHALLLEAGKPIRALAVASGRVWAIAGDELWVVASPPSTPKRVRASGVLDVVAAGTQLYLLSAVDGALVVERFRGDDGDWQRLFAFAPSAAPTGGAIGPTLAASSDGRAVAVVVADELATSWDGGATFETTPEPGLVGACFSGLSVASIGTTSGKPLVVLRNEGGVVSISVRRRDESEEIAIADERFAVVALSTEGARLAWCDVRDALFIATATGSLAIGPRQSH